MIQFIAVIGISVMTYFLFKKTYNDMKNHDEKSTKVDKFKTMYGESWGDQYERMLDNNNWMDR